MKRAVRRFRPIPLTAIAFLLGCVPVLTNSASNSVLRHGTPVISGLLAASLISMLLIPALANIRKAIPRASIIKRTAPRLLLTLPTITAFILGCVSLWSNSVSHTVLRLGTPVIGVLLAVGLIALFLIPAPVDFVQTHPEHVIMKRTAPPLLRTLLTAVAFILGSVPLCSNFVSNIVARFRRPVTGGPLAPSLISMFSISVLLNSYATISVTLAPGRGVI
jgi:Cu/Ag efflux pump CusA